MGYAGSSGRVRYSEQLNWYIDSAGTLGGDDGNPGTAAAPLRTLREWKRRVGPAWEPPGFGILELMTDCDESASILMVARAGLSNGTLRGRRTMGVSGNVDAATALVAASKSYATITCADQDWSPYIGERIWIQGTDDDWTPGLFAYILADAGSGVAVLTPWVNALGDYNVAPSPGATWQIYTVPELSGQIAVMGVGSGHYAGVDLDIGGNAGFAGLYVTGSDRSQVHGVKIKSDGYTLESGAGATLEAHGCYADGGHLRTQGGELMVFGGAARGNGSRIYALGGYVEISAAVTLSEGAYLAVEGGGTMLVAAPVGVRSSANRALRATRGSIQLSGLVFATGNTASAGIEIEAGQEILCASGNLPTLDTPTAFANVGGVTKSRANLATDYMNPNNGARFAYKVL